MYLISVHTTGEYVYITAGNTLLIAKHTKYTNTRHNQETHHVQAFGEVVGGV